MRSKNKMTRIFSIRLFSMLALCALIGVGQVFAQSTVAGAINGKVTDPQGSVVPNASVKITNIETNNSITVSGNEDGGYRSPNLAPGKYRVEVTVTGFSVAKAEPITVEVGVVTPVDIPLKLGTATAEVDVTAEAPVINTNDSTNSTNINQTSLSELPINGRRAVNFVLLTPSTVPDGTFGLVSFRGISGVLNNSQVDGGDNNQAWQSEERGRTRIGYVVSQSAIREFQVNSSNYSAEYGRSAGGVVNTVTKSGTNEFHGEVFEFYRNNRFGARNPSAFKATPTGPVAYKPVDVRHQFGVNVCGPIKKDHVFFCFTHDQQKRNFPGLSIPGNFSVTNLSATQRTQLNGLGISTPQIDSTLAFVDSLTGEVPRRGDQRIIFPKIDWNINKNNTFTASYNRLRWFSPAGLQTQATNRNGRASFGDDLVNVDTFNVRVQSTISQNAFNEWRFQWSKELGQALSQAPLPGEPATATTSQGQRSPQIVLGSGNASFTFGTTTNFERNAYPDERRVQVADALTITSGRHTFKFGGEYSRVRERIAQLFSEAGSYVYADILNFIVDYVRWKNPTTVISNCATTGTGRVPGRCYTSNYQQGIGVQGLSFSIREYAFFAQDDFRITPRFTLNLGMRWEYQQLPDPPLANTSTVVIPRDGRTLAEATSTLPNDKNNFGPRVGFSYDVFGDGRTSLRGGYGIYYGRMMAAQIYNSMLNTGNPGGAGTVSLSNSTAGAPTFPNVLPNNSVSLGLAGIQFFQRDFQAPLINQYDLILERQIAKNTAVSISYVGSLGRNLPTFVDMNLVQSATTLFTISGGPRNGQTFTLPLYTRPAGTPNVALTQIQSNVESQYDAMILQANRRFTNGLQFQASYTLAKATDTNQNSSIFPVANATLDPFDRSYDAGPSNNDVRHKFVVSAVYSPSWKTAAKSFADYAVNGWTFSPIVTLYSGKPFDSFISNLNGSNGNARFPLDARNAYRLPAIKNMDLRVSKRFNFTERYNLEVIGEGFNVFNRTHIFQVANALYTRGSGANSGVLTYQTALTSFGGPTITDSFNYRERQIQFAARFHF